LNFSSIFGAQIFISLRRVKDTNRGNRKQHSERDAKSERTVNHVFSFIELFELYLLNRKSSALLSQKIKEPRSRHIAQSGLWILDLWPVNIVTRGFTAPLSPPLLSQWAK